MNAERLPYIILLTHGNWGEELIKGAEMICGDIENIYAFSLLPEHTMEEYMKNIENLLYDWTGGSIIITDLFGSTTSNIAAVISSKFDTLALSGLNISMLLAAYEFRTEYTGDELADKIIEKSIDNFKNIKKMLKEIHI